MKPPRWIVLLVVMSPWMPGSSARADFLAFDTSQSPFNPGQDNQGYYQRTEARVLNSNYFAAAIFNDAGDLGASWHDYFTFDLRGLDPSLKVVSATLEVMRYFQQSPQTLQLWDVTTTAETLNTTATSDPSVYLPIYEDLGSGTSYGTFLVPVGASSDTLSFDLNASALADIAATAGLGFFSIGGSLDVAGLTGTQTLFSGSGAEGFQRLVLEVQAVPEPAAAALLVLGMVTFLGASTLARSRTVPTPQS